MELVSTGDMCDMKIDDAKYTVQTAVFKSGKGKRLRGYVVFEIIYIGTDDDIAYLAIVRRDPMTDLLITHVVSELGVDKFAIINLDSKDDTELGMSPNLVDVPQENLWAAVDRLLKLSQSQKAPDKSGCAHSASKMTIYQLCMVKKERFVTKKPMCSNCPSFSQLVDIVAKNLKLSAD